MFLKLKSRIKYLRDSLYSINLPGKESIGVEDVWTILTRDLKHPVVYSGGVGKNITFELELINRFDATIYAFDPTETGIKTINALPTSNRLHFYQVALSDIDGILELNLPVNIQEGSYTKGVFKGDQNFKTGFPCRKISSLMNELGHSKLDILKIDIEGSEYEVINNVLDEKIEFDQLCVEFHHFFKSIPRKATSDILKRLKMEGYQLFHKRELDFSFCKVKNLKH